MPSNSTSRAPADRAGDGPAADGRISLSALPWMTTVGAVICAVVAQQAAAAEDGGEMPADAGRIVGAVVALDGLGADRVLAARDSRGCR